MDGTFPDESQANNAKKKTKIISRFSDIEDMATVCVPISRRAAGLSRTILRDCNGSGSRNVVGIASGLSLFVGPASSSSASFSEEEPSHTQGFDAFHIWRNREAKY